MRKSAVVFVSLLAIISVPPSQSSTDVSTAVDPKTTEDAVRAAMPSIDERKKTLDAAMVERDNYWAQGFDIPRYMIAVFDFRMSWVDGFAVGQADMPPLKYMIVIRPASVLASPVEWVAAHEIAHVMAIENGLGRTEEIANRIVACFATPVARKFTVEHFFTPTATECRTTREALQRDR